MNYYLHGLPLHDHSTHRCRGCARGPHSRRGRRIYPTPESAHWLSAIVSDQSTTSPFYKHGSAREAEAKLADRETRVEALKIRELGVTERERFVTEWHTVQSRFVDHPRTAVTEADDLINALLEARGYPQAGFEQRAADISVNYPRVMENYRRRALIAVRLGQVEATTEELRTAMIQYRDIFDDLLQAPKAHRNKNRRIASSLAARRA